MKCLNCLFLILHLTNMVVFSASYYMQAYAKLFVRTSLINTFHIKYNSRALQPLNWRTKFMTLRETDTELYLKLDSVYKYSGNAFSA
jgi:hypothetical protein